MHAAAYRVSLTLEMQGDRAGAIEALRLAVRYQPQQAEMQRQLGELLEPTAATPRLWSICGRRWT